MKSALVFLLLAGLATLAAVLGATPLDDRMFNE